LKERTENYLTIFDTQYVFGYPVPLPVVAQTLSAPIEQPAESCKNQQKLDDVTPGRVNQRKPKPTRGLRGYRRHKVSPGARDFAKLYRVSDIVRSIVNIISAISTNSAKNLKA
jgi:hypothetical protein